MFVCLSELPLCNKETPSEEKMKENPGDRGNINSKVCHITSCLCMILVFWVFCYMSICFNPDLIGANWLLL